MAECETNLTQAQTKSVSEVALQIVQIPINTDLRYQGYQGLFLQDFELAIMEHNKECAELKENDEFDGRGIPLSSEQSFEGPGFMDFTVEQQSNLSILENKQVGEFIGRAINFLTTQKGILMQKRTAQILASCEPNLTGALVSELEQQIAHLFESQKSTYEQQVLNVFAKLNLQENVQDAYEELVSGAHEFYIRLEKAVAGYQTTQNGNFYSAVPCDAKDLHSAPAANRTLYNSVEVEFGSTLADAERYLQAFNLALDHGLTQTTAMQIAQTVGALDIGGKGAGALRSKIKAAIFAPDKYAEVCGAVDAQVADIMEHKLPEQVKFFMQNLFDWLVENIKNGIAKAANELEVLSEGPLEFDVPLTPDTFARLEGIYYTQEQLQKAHEFVAHEEMQLAAMRTQIAAACAS